jgi:C1A family cysteine protease
MKCLLSFACLLLSLVVLGSAISPRFDERSYTILADSLTARSEFNQWTRQNARSYASQEFEYRYNVWRDNYAFIEHFNANANASFTLALNPMADMTQDEVARINTGFVAPPAGMMTGANPLEAERELSERQVPSSFDWRTQGAVTAIKNQGSCGACYTFSANGAIEGMYKIAAGTLPTLSEQMLRTSPPPPAFALFLFLFFFKKNMKN